MIKTMTKFIAGFAAAASLLLATGCTNQLDYVNDNTALNKFNITGLKVTGLDKSYNGADIKLMVNKGKDGTEDYAAYVSGTVASSYTNEKGDVVGYQSGSAYIKLDAPKLFDGDSLHTSKFECYLSVGNDKIQVLSSDGTKLENAKLAVPTSPAGTRDANLKSKFVEIVVNDGIGTFSFADKSAEPVNVTMYKVKMDLLNCTADNLPAGVEVTTVAKTGTNQKFTLTMKGLKENAGTEVVLGGADISSTDGSLGNNWYDVENFKKTISDEGEVSWSFYGSAVNGGNISTWGRVYTENEAGPEIVINEVSDKKENGNRLLMSSVSRSGKENIDENFMFPAYTIGDYDVKLTIDVSKLDSTSWEKNDPVAKTSKLYIDGIKIINSPKPKEADEAIYIVDADDDTAENKKERICFVPGNTWKVDSYHYAAADINGNGNYAWKFDKTVEFVPNKASFKIGARLVRCSTDSWSWNDQFGQGNAGYSVHYLTEEYADGHYTLIIDNSKSTLLEYLLPTDSVDYEFEVSYTKVVLDKALENVELIGRFNSWTDSGTIAGVVTGNSTVFNISNGVDIAADGFKIRTVGKWDSINLGKSNGENISLGDVVITKSGEYIVNLTYSDAGITKVSVESEK